MSSEQAVVTARASVLLYDDAGKQWVPSGSCKQQQEVSRVQLFHHAQQNTFRVVGRKLQDQEVVVNCSVGRGFKYNITSDTFHQWKDQQILYGLNFLSHEDANSFGSAMIKVVEVVNSSVCGPPQGVRPAVVCRPQGPTVSRPMTNGGDCYDDRNSLYVQNRRTVAETPTGSVYASAGYATANCGSNGQPMNTAAQKATCGQSPPAALPMPSTLAASNGARRTPSVNGKKPIISNSAPPPPPLPNMANFKPSSCNPSAGRPTNLADALATAKLRKVPTPATSTDTKNGSRSASVGSIDTSVATYGRSSGTSSVASFGHDDVISEITATLAKRKMLQESQQLQTGCNSEDVEAADATPCRLDNADGRKSFRSVDNNNAAAAVHRKMPSGSSLSSQEENGTSVSSQRGLTNGHLATTLTMPSLAGGAAVDLLDALKLEIVNCIREEVARAKVELIESFRTELSRQLKVSDFGQSKLR